MSRPPNPLNPFPGLRPFSQEEDYLFFGREEQTLELLQRLSGHRFVAVVGTSGSGKSSLVRCGLLAELLGGRMLGAGALWEVAVTHPGGSPLALLAEAILAADVYDREQENARENLLATLSRSHFGLVEAVRQARLGKDTNFLLVVDQFEEIFRFHETGQTQQEMANEFVSLLLEAVAQKEVPIYIVLTMRSDFIGECGQFEGLAEMVNRGEFLIPRLTRDQYKRVIEGPIRVAGGQIAPRLLQRLLNDLAQQADQLPCLQHALMRTWSVWSEKGESDALDLEDYQRVGRMSEALSLHADEIYDALETDRQRQLCRGLFQALTVQESENRGTRRPQRLGRLCQILEVPADELLPIIDAYRQSGVTFLMPSRDVDLTDRTIIDISHESLMRVWIRLRHWVEQEAQSAGIYLRLSESAALHAQEKAGLYRDPELGIALAWQESQRPNAAWAARYRPGFDAAIAFLAASREASLAEEQAREAARHRELVQAQELAEARQQRLLQQQRSASRLRRMIAGLAAVAIIAVGTSIVAGKFWQQASAAKREAETSAELARRSAETAKENAATARREAARANEQKQIAEENLNKAERAEKEANEQRSRADETAEDAQQSLYYAQMHLAQQAWREHRGLLYMRELLSNWLPADEPRDRRGWEWFYLNSLPYQNLQTLSEGGAGKGPCTVAWHVGSKRLAEGTADGMIRIWDVDRERITLILRGPAPWVQYWGGTWLAWSPDGTQLAAGSRAGTVHVHDTRSGKELQLLRGPESPVLSVCFSSDGTQVAAWEVEGTFNIWDVATGRLNSDVVHPGGVTAGRWSPDNKLIATGHEDGTVTVSGARADSRIATLQAHVDGIYHLEWSPDSTRLATTSANDFFVSVWDIAAEKKVLGPFRHSHGITSIAWEPGGQRLATGSMDEAVKIWNTMTGLETVTLRGQVQSITSLSWGDGGRLASGGSGGSLRIWNSIFDQESRVLPGHIVRATSVSWSPDGGRLASGGDDGKIRIWDPDTREQMRTVEGHNTGGIIPQFGLIRSLAWSPDGSYLASAGLDGRAGIWEAASGRSIFTLPADHGAIWCVAWNPDGTSLAAGSEFGTIRVVEGLKQTPNVRSFQAHERQGRPKSEGVRALAWSPTGDRLASAGFDGLVKIWDPLNNAELARMPGHRGWVLGVAWSPDGKRLASAGSDRLVISWEAGTGQRLSTMRGHNDFVDAVKWSPDGTRLASAGIDNSVRVWDPRTGQETFVLRGTSGMFHDVSWHPEGTRLASASSDGRIWIWDATPGFVRDTTPRALAYIERMVASGTASGEELFWCAESYVRAGKHAEALVALSDDAYSLSKLARHLDQQGNGSLADEARTEARGLLERQLMAEPDNEAPASALADLLLHEWSDRVADMKTTDPWVRLAVAYWLGSNQPAFNRLLEHHPEAAVAIADFYAAEQDWERAIAEYSELVTEQAADGNVFVKRALAYESTGQWNLAAEDWSRAARQPSVLASDLTEVVAQEARRLVQSGVGAFEQGRWDEAVRDLQLACDRLRVLHQAAPGDVRVASRLAISLLSFSNAVKKEQRLDDAFASLQEARQVLEGIRRPAFVDLYNLACTYSNLTTLVAPGSEPLTSAEQEALADLAMNTLRRSLAAGMSDFALLNRDPDLDPLRERPDFRALILESSGRTREAVPHLATLSSARPHDSILALKVATLQAWFGQEQELAATRRRLLAFAEGIKDSGTAERVAMACSIRASNDEAELSAVLTLGRTAVQLDRRVGTLLALGMAEYRSGNHAAAEEALLAAAQAGDSSAWAMQLSAFYRAMSLFRKGNEDEARKMAAEAAAHMKPLPADENNPLAGDAKYDDLILWLAYQEAKSLIQFDQDSPPTHSVRPPRSTIIPARAR